MANKHDFNTLVQFQSLPLQAKEIMSLERIRAWYEEWKQFELFNPVTGNYEYKASIGEPIMTKNQIINQVFDGAVYVSFSGGKDSTVLADLCARFCKDNGYKLRLMYLDTGLEFPEIRKHVKAFHKYLEEKYKLDIELYIIRPKKRFVDVIIENGYPLISKEISKNVECAKIYLEDGQKYKIFYDKINGTYLNSKGELSKYNCARWKFLLDAPFKISNKCCYYMKKAPAKVFESEHALKPILGILAEESTTRAQEWVKSGCNLYTGRHASSKPMSFWTDQDVLEYIQKYKLPLASVYGDIVTKDGKLVTTGAERTGCVFCGFGCQFRKDDRFLRLKETHPKLYNYCINGGEYNADGMWIPNKNGLGMSKLLDYIDRSDKY